MRLIALLRLRRENQPQAYLGGAIEKRVVTSCAVPSRYSIRTKPSLKLESVMTR